MSSTDEPTAVMRYAVNYTDGAGNPQTDRFETPAETVARAQYLRARGREFEMFEIVTLDVEAGAW